MIRRVWRENHSYVAWVVCLGAVLYVGLAGRTTSGQLQRQAALGAQTHAAVCALRSDLEQRVASGEAFLRAHPHGAFGLTAKVIRASILNEQKTVQALAALQCQ